MVTIFEKVINHDALGYLIWEDDEVVAFLDTHPHSAGHTLVVPRRPEPHWTDLTDQEGTRLFWVAKEVARAQRDEFDCARAGLVIAGYHVPHTHLHVFPTNDMDDFDFRDLPREASPSELARDASRLRTALIRHGHGQYVA